MKKNQFIIWGTYCNKCGSECSILQNEHHPWINTTFTVNVKCNSCGNEMIIDKNDAEAFYNNRIYSYYDGLYGKVIDLGCGSGFLSRYLITQNKVEKIYGLDVDKDCFNELLDIINDEKKFEFINSDVINISERFDFRNIDFLISRDAFMFIENTDRYFNDITKIVTKGIRQMGWYLKENSRMKNKLEPQQIANEYTKRGWTVKLEYLDWYKCGYFINANKL